LILGKLSSIIKSKVIVRGDASQASVSPTKSNFSLSGEKPKMKKMQSVVLDTASPSFAITP
jgi:hypothetical protein